MNIKTNCSADGDVLTIRVSGAFDFKSHAEFRRAYEGVSPRPRRIVVDLAEADYVDSSALGMLLLLRQHAGCDDRCITLANVQPAVARILAVANFQKLFDVA